MYARLSTKYTHQVLFSWLLAANSLKSISLSHVAEFAGVVLLVLIALATANAKQTDTSEKRTSEHEIRAAWDWSDAAFGEPCGVWGGAKVEYENGSEKFLDEFIHLSQGDGVKANFPFSFVYDGKSSDEMLTEWKFSRRSHEADDCRKTVITYESPNTGLFLECHLTVYSDLPGIDWLFFLENKSDKETPIIDHFLPLDAILLRAVPDESIVLRSSSGDDNVASETFVSYMPLDESLGPGQTRQFAPKGGRSSNAGVSSNGVTGGSFPFFNVIGPECGWVLAIGWSGQWAAEFTRKPTGELAVSAGMETTHFRLRPGERVRSPRIVLLRYEGGDLIKGHNSFRRLMIKHYVQQRDGAPAAPPICHNTAGTIYRSGEKANEQNQLSIIEEAARLGCEAYWMDAYWYPQPWGINVGNWYPRADDFPRGLRALSDAAHKAGMKFVLWAEPERAYSGTELFNEHPEFLLGGGNNRLFDLGNPKAREYMTHFLDEKIKQWGVDVYRNDFNINPLPYWKAKDEPDRQGVAEMQYISGLYQMWSDLMGRNPGLTIDNCASGGRRIDVELCSLSYPLWRSDLNDIGEGLKGKEYWPRMGMADQVHNTGLSLYIPFHSGPLWDMHPYSVRSSMNSTVVLYERIMHEQFPTALAKKALQEVKDLRKYWTGDLYPLLALTPSQRDWYAFQLHRSDLDEGIALFFRRPECSEAQNVVSLQEIVPDALYEVSLTGETYDRGPWVHQTGKELANVNMTINSKPGSALLRYKRSSKETVD